MKYFYLFFISNTSIKNAVFFLHIKKLFQNITQDSSIFFHIETETETKSRKIY